MEVKLQLLFSPVEVRERLTYFIEKAKVILTAYN